MLRITRLPDQPSVVKLKVEGRIASDEVEVLERECLQHMIDGGQVSLDFSGVTYINRAGVAMLKRLSEGKLKIMNCSPLTKDLLLDEGIG